MQSREHRCHSASNDDGIDADQRGEEATATLNMTISTSRYRERHSCVGIFPPPPPAPSSPGWPSALHSPAIRVH